MSFGHGDRREHHEPHGHDWGCGGERRHEYHECDCEGEEHAPRHGCTCGCGCHCCCGHGGRHQNGGRFQRRFQMREERAAGLEEYLKALRAEAQAVEELLARMKSEG